MNFISIQSVTAIGECVQCRALLIKHQCSFSIDMGPFKYYVALTEGRGSVRMWKLWRREGRGSVTAWRHTTGNSLLSSSLQFTHKLTRTLLSLCLVQPPTYHRRGLTMLNIRINLNWKTLKWQLAIDIGETRSVAAGFGRHGMPPPACNDTGTTFCFPNKEETEMRRTDDVSLWLWSLTVKLVRNVARVVEYSPANFGYSFWLFDYSFPIYGLLGVARAG